MISELRSRFFVCQCGEPLSGVKEGSEKVCRALLCVHLTLTPWTGASFLVDGCQLCIFTNISVISVCASSGCAHTLFVILIVCVCGRELIK